MRPPRYRFPDEVRNTTRAIAARMVREGTVARSPEELDQWIAAEPDVRRPLESGGYGTRFTSHDLFPLLQVFLGPAATPAVDEVPAEAAAPRPRRTLWIAALAVLVLLLLLALALATDAFSRPAERAPRSGMEAPTVVDS